MPREKIRIAYLVSHPIQYQVPLLRLVSACPELDLKVLFQHQASTRQHFDKGFGHNIAWDLPLLDGYSYETLPGRDPIHFGIRDRLKTGKFQILWIHGYSHPTNMRAMTAANRLGIKVLLRGESNLLQPGTPLKNALKRRYLQWCFQRCDGFLCIGKLNREFYLRHGQEESRMFEMPYAVDNDFFRQQIALAHPNREQFRASLGLLRNRPVILFVGKLLPHKGPGDLLEAYIRIVSDWSRDRLPYLVFAGSGAEREKLEQRARQSGLDSLRFLGFQNQTELPRVLDLCDLFVLPSHVEPWGLVVNEVMNAGKPLLLSDAAGCAPDLVESGKNGWMFRAGDVASLTEALRTALTSSDRLAEMGHHSLRRISGWSFKEDVRGLLTAADQMLGRQTAPLAEGAAT